ncbi:MAG: putative addiction module antidote protein [Methylobacteriaceae bacterium]|jgi:probable addiction module antidote protein|nr:putative addiction module antidote protein [Methylobacteriaceae bacterium]
MVKIREFDATRYLDNDEVIRECLAACLEDSDPAVFLTALGDVAKAKGVTQLAKDTGLSRESLYKTFSEGTKPRFETIVKITRALGVPLSLGRNAGHAGS